MIRFLVFLSAIFVTTSTAFAQQGSGLDALDRRGDLLGWEAVGRLDKPGGFCTGALIASDLVLTAAHCVFDSNGKLFAPEKMLFRAGYSEGKSIAERRGEKIAVPKTYHHSTTGQHSANEVGSDVALIRLSSPIFSSEANPFRVHENPTEGERVSVLSYGRGRTETLSRQAECNITGRYDNGIMSFDCDVTFGSSGAPVFIRYGNRVRILSLISGGRDFGSKQVISFGMELPTVVADLKRELRQGAARPQVTVGARRITVGQRSTGGARFVKP